jgi:hypothetical protein
MASHRQVVLPGGIYKKIERDTNEDERRKKAVRIKWPPGVFEKVFDRLKKAAKARKEEERREKAAIAKAKKKNREEATIIRKEKGKRNKPAIVRKEKGKRKKAALAREERKNREETTKARKRKGKHRKATMVKETENEGYIDCRLGDSLSELHIDLGMMSLNYYLRNQQWREVFLRCPTRNAAGNRGNNFPGFYYYDFHAGYEWVVVVDGSVDWRTTVCERKVIQGRLKIGVASSSDLPGSIHLKAWYGRRNSIPTKWEALKVLVEKSFELAPLPKPQQSEPDWLGLGQKVLSRLKDPRLQVTCGGVTGFVSMLEEGNHAYLGEHPTLELMCNASLAKSLLLAAGLPGLQEASALASPIVETVIPRFYRTDLGVYANDYPSKLTDDGRPDVFETWYLLSNLDNVLQIVKATGDDRLKEQCQNCLNTIMSTARDVDYIFPLFLQLRTPKEDYGTLLNPSVLGIYASIFIRGAELFPSDCETYTSEAMKALRVMRRLPLDSLYHETCQLSLAAFAAHSLEQLMDDHSMRTWRDDFVRMLLLSMYRSRKCAGLFQACAGIMYPAFKENIEAVEPLSWFLEGAELPLADILALSIRNNVAYLRDGQIPVEALGTREFPMAGAVETAVYAAGHVLDMARIQHRLAKTESTGAGD